MKFFKNKLNRKGWGSLIGVIFLVFLGSTQFANADIFGIGSISSGIFATASFAISYVLAFIFGVLIAVEAWLIGIVLNINANILQTTLVQTGFSISLSIANLAFVLGIIVIALATILRNQTYGIKQLLWKLVVMAILVNFGLVIMSPIFAIGNSFTQYFLNCINPGSGGCTQNASSLSSFNTFGTTMAAAFNPANPFTAPATASSTSGIQSLLGGYNLSTTGGSIGQSIVPVFGIIFTAVDLCLIVIVLGGFIALLTIRYLYIAILAILLPFAWASWVFPSFSSHWKKWWEQFIRWTFFAPIVLFFIYLALLTMKTVGSTGVFNMATYTTGTTWTSISQFLTNAFAPIMSSFVQEILLGGLIVGGMMAANSMGIKMAGAVVETAKKGGNAAKGWAQKQTKKGGVWAYQKTDRGVKKVTGAGLTERLQTGNIPLQSIPGVRRGASLLARGIQSSSVASNAKMVEDAQKKAPKSWDAAKKNLEGSMNTEDQFAHIAVGIKEGKIKADDMVNGQKVSQFLDDQDLIARYGQGKLVSDFDKVTLSNANSRRATNAIKNGEAEVKIAKDIKDENGKTIPGFEAGKMANAKAVKKEAEREFYQGNEKVDFAKAAKDHFSPASKSKDFAEYMNKLNNFAEYRPDAVPDIMKKMDAVTLENFYTDYKSTLNKFIEKTKKDIVDTEGEIPSATLDRIKTLQSLGDKRTPNQREELQETSFRYEKELRDIKSLNTKLARAEEGNKKLKKNYEARFSSADHEEHHDDAHDDKHDDKKDGSKKSGGGGHAPAPKPAASAPTPPPAASGGGGDHGGHGH
jgi:predicted RNA-binding protein with PIN domain